MRFLGLTRLAVASGGGSPGENQKRSNNNSNGARSSPDMGPSNEEAKEVKLQVKDAAKAQLAIAAEKKTLADLTPAGKPVPYVNASGGRTRAPATPRASLGTPTPAPPLALPRPARVLQNKVDPYVLTAEDFQDGWFRKGGPFVADCDVSSAQAVIVEDVFHAQESAAALLARLFGMRFACRSWVTSGTQRKVSRARGRRCGSSLDTGPFAHGSFPRNEARRVLPVCQSTDDAQVFLAPRQFRARSSGSRRSNAASRRGCPVEGRAAACAQRRLSELCSFNRFSMPARPGRKHAFAALLPQVPMGNPRND